MTQTTKTSKAINASIQSVYNAITNPKSMEVWQAPGNMTAKVHNFDFRIGGGYEMSLYYPESETGTQGKTQAKEDRYTARFIDIVPHQKIVQTVNFKSSNPDFWGDMIVEILLAPKEKVAEVIYTFKNIPIGIRPEDNEAGTRSSLQKLADYVENNRKYKE